MRIDTLVCVEGLEVFQHPSGDYPCDSRWVDLKDAERLLGVADGVLSEMAIDRRVPTDWRGWVSLDWVEKLIDLRKRHQAETGRRD